MTAVFVYIIRRLRYRIAEFFRHWYVKSVRMYFNFILDCLARLDYVLAWRITARHLFEPLYKDYSFVGYVLGFVFRSVRLLVAGMVYAALFGVALGSYFVWLLIPPLLLILAFAPPLLL
ncbi:MAG: hypothetical protein HYU81_01900 [Candidatus Brennerbacteria bacterium]|nr:hypothetical protein [Candidatus Brennerbacteria bacterium]